MNKNVFLREYVPNQLKGRERELQSLNRAYKHLTENSEGFVPIILVRGPPGSGKTVTTKYFGNDLEKTAQEKEMNLKYLHIGNFDLQTRKSVLRTILSYVRPFSSQGSIKTMLGWLKETLKKENMYLLLTIDEPKFFPINRAIMNLFTEINKDCPSSSPRLSLLLIPGQTARLDPWLKIYMQNPSRNIIDFPAYSHPQLVSILNERVKKGFHLIAVPPEIIKQVAAIAVHKKGDAQYAIDLLTCARERAERLGASKVYKDHVRDAKRQIYKPYLVQLLIAATKNLRLNVIVPPIIIEQISAIAVDEKGSKHFALYILSHAAQKAENIGLKEIYPDLVREIVSKITFSVVLPVSAFSELTKHELLILLSISRKLQSTEGVHLSLHELHEIYSLICERKYIRPKGKNEVNQYCQKLANIGLLRVYSNIENKNYKAAQISIDIPLKELEDTLERILGD